jgi:hydrogenase nickel incorporation protein HypA/HybF
MHEVSIVQSLINIVCNKAQENNLKKINKVSLKIGELSGVFEDSIRFAYKSISKDTIVEGAELVIERVEAYAKCDNCDISFKIKHFNKLCPECQIFSSNILSGYELYINTIEGD